MICFSCGWHCLIFTAKKSKDDKPKKKHAEGDHKLVSSNLPFEIYTHKAIITSDCIFTPSILLWRLCICSSSQASSVVLSWFNYKSCCPMTDCHPHWDSNKMFFLFRLFSSRKTGFQSYQWRTTSRRTTNLLHGWKKKSVLTLMISRPKLHENCSHVLSRDGTEGNSNLDTTRESPLPHEQLTTGWSSIGEKSSTVLYCGSSVTCLLASCTLAGWWYQRYISI